MITVYTHKNPDQSNEPSDTIEAAVIRAERQRSRANKWQKRAASLMAEKEQQEYDLEQRRLALETHFLSVTAEMEAQIDARVREYESKLSDMSVALQVKKRECNSQSDRIDNLRAQIARDEKFVKMGKYESVRRREARRARLAEKLVSEYQADSLVPWVDRALRRYLSVPGHVRVTVIEGSTSKPKLTGEPGHHTTPSGKTIVKYPNAYKWRTVYHCSTEELIVGARWLDRNIKKLAKSEATARMK